MMTMIGSDSAVPGVSITMSAAEPISHRRNNVDFTRLLMASLQHYGWWLSLLLYAPGIARQEGKLNDWMPVLIVGLFVVCVTAFLLLDPKSRTPKR
jgi:hypothetical protein